MMTFRKISAECNGKFVAAYFTEGAPDPEHDFRTDTGKVPDGDGQRLTNYYLGRDGRASFNPGMSQQMADVLGVDRRPMPTTETLAALFEGKRADNGEQWSQAKRKISAYDLTMAPHKSVTLAAEFAPTQAEGAAIWNAVQRANDATMQYVARELGFARRGHGGEDGEEAGEVAWTSYRHRTSRPTLTLHDAETDTTYLREAPTGGDPQMHIHNSLYNVVVTESGHVGSLDTKRLRSRVHEFGAFFQAELADELRKLGIAQSYDAKEQAKISMLTGVAGSGKTTLLQPLVDAWKRDTRFSEEGREIIGLATAWRQADALGDAGIHQRYAMMPFLSRLEKGEQAVDENTVLVIDEVGQIAPRQMLQLLELQRASGCTIKALGDREQAQSIEAGDTVEILRRVLAKEDMPELLSTVRQTTARNREIAGLFRGETPDADALDALRPKGKAAYANRDQENADDPRNAFHFEEVRRAIDMKREDGTIRLVGGDQDEVLQKIVELYVTRRDALAASGSKRGISMSALTNQDAADLSRAVRRILQNRGEISRDEVKLDAVDQRGETYELQVAAGDRLRLFRRTWGAVEGKGTTVGNNGDVVEVVSHGKDGLKVRMKDGREADVEWRRLKDHKTGRILLGFGHAMTIDAAQGLTSDEHINALPRGVATATGFTSYVAESRAKGTTWTMISDGATFEAVRNGRALGDTTEITSDDLWNHVAKGMSNKPYKALGMDLPFTSQEEREKHVQELIRLGKMQEEMAQEGRDYGREVANRVQAIAVEKSAAPRLKDLDSQIEALMISHSSAMSREEHEVRLERVAKLMKSISPEL
ncbi:conjugal transfer protein TraA [Acetobacter malorum]|uniref:Conjugal transfer protein TraA n=1 Tax=Acetobacter malorum TaxID=178901 RepID=A0A149S3T2_9PROT|nr:MobF family relaxase [Acetobacter malorum]KXV21253.1 conjugal transfer protein TraA [Acetobacter malorum]